MPTATPKPLTVRTATAGNGDDGADAVLTIEIRAEDRDSLPGLISEVRKSVKRGDVTGEGQFCSGAYRFSIAYPGESS